MLVSRLMQSPVHTVFPWETCITAASRMAEKNVGSLVVVTEDNHLLGIVTDRDIVRRLLATGKPIMTTVGQIMTKDVVTIDSLANIGDAAHLMAEKTVKRLVVVFDEKVAGILTATDILVHDRNIVKPIIESRIRQQLSEDAFRN